MTDQGPHVVFRQSGVACTRGRNAQSFQIGELHCTACGKTVAVTATAEEIAARARAHRVEHEKRGTWKLPEAATT